jgi:hypothetical protein
MQQRGMKGGIYHGEDGQYMKEFRRLGFSEFVASGGI